MTKKKILIISAASIVVVVAVILAIVGRNRLKGGITGERKDIVLSTAMTDISKASEKKAEEYEMKVVCENASHALFIRESDALVGLYDKKSGEVFFSHPENPEGVKTGTNFDTDMVKGDLNVKFTNENVQPMEMNSFLKCAADGQAEFEYRENGVKITYTIGETATKLIMPQAITIERFESFLSKMDEKVQKKVKRNYLLLDKDTLKKADYETYLETYIGLNDHPIYIIKDGTKDYLREEIAGYFVEAGYTEEDCLKDLEENVGEASTKKPWFIIPVDFRLEEDSMIIEVLSSEIKYNDDGYYLTDIELVPFFGTETESDNGYMFIPDGSGALISLNNMKTSAGAYFAKVYGIDETLNIMNKWQGDIDESHSVKMPVFGIKNEEKAWLAVIEQGDGYASISADIAGKTSPFYHVYTDFAYKTYGAITLGDVIGSRDFAMYSSPSTEENYRLRIFTLSGKDADYSGMAVRYRNYLEEIGTLTKTVKKDVTPLYIEFIGAIEKTVSTLGIKHESTVALTTFEQARRIDEMLKEKGVTYVKNVFIGFSDGGLDQPAASGIKVEKKLEKDGMTLKEFAASCRENGIELFPVIDLQHVYDNTFSDGYSAQTGSPRYFDRSVVRTGEVFVNNGRIAHRKTNLVSPFFETSIASIAAKRMNKYEVGSLGVSYLTHMLYSDYDKDSYTDRQSAIFANEAALSILKEKFKDGLLGDNANVYAFETLTDVTDVPFTSNGMRLLDESVPFYQMVIKGYKDFTGEAMNLSDDYRTQLLRSVECGAGIDFKWIATSNSVIKDSDYDELYSVYYETWLDQAVADWKKVSEVNAGIYDKRIIGHEKIYEGVFVTTYEDGSKVCVNYSDSAVLISGVKVEPKDFERIK